VCSLDGHEYNFQLTRPLCLRASSRHYATPMAVSNPFEHKTLATLNKIPERPVGTSGAPLLFSVYSGMKATRVPENGSTESSKTS
jgi:hypothetical protein